MMFQLLSHMRSHPVNMQANLSCEDRDLSFGLDFNLRPCSMFACDHLQDIMKMTQV